MVNVKRYIIDYVKMVRDRVPVDLREFPDLMAYLNVIVGPVVSIYNSLNLYRNLVLYKLTITPQVCYLEKMLNNQYDNTERRIYIEDGSQYEGQFVFQDADSRRVFLALWIVVFLFVQPKIGKL